jgi:hypothetical protein
MLLRRFERNRASSNRKASRNPSRRLSQGQLYLLNLRPKVGQLHHS